MKHELWINIQSVSVHVQCHVEGLRPVVEQLALDFEAFDDQTALEPADICVEIVSQIPSQATKERWVAFPVRSSFVKTYGWARKRRCLFAEGVAAESILVNGHRFFWISGQRPELVREVIYTFIHSALGEELDKRGFHRIHALGVEIGGTIIVMSGPSGVGKSSLACLLSPQSNVRLFSDESPLLQKQTLHPFPLRLALAPSVARALKLKTDSQFQRRQFAAKSLMKFPRHKMARSKSVDVVMTAKKTQGPPRLLEVRAWVLLPNLFLHLVVGLGLAQMAEWMLRIDAFPGLFRIARSRLMTLLVLLYRTKRFYRFYLSEDAVANTNYLRAFFDSPALRTR